jgi:site-specific DNA recombinase
MRMIQPSSTIHPIENTSGRAAIYARVSSDQQAQVGTIASQVGALEERLAADGLKLDPELRFIDEGHSGATLARPALERLRDMADAGAIDCLYVHCPDRLARSYAWQVLLVDELRRCGVRIVFLNRELGRSPEDDLLLQVQGIVSEYERAKILERSRRGKLHAARSGRVSVLSTAPYGYRYVSKYDGGGEAVFNVQLEEAAVVRQVFQWVGGERLSIGEACRRLKARAIASPKGKDHWDRTTVWGILKNPAYKGQAAFGKTRVGERRPMLRPQRKQSEQPRKACGVYDTPPEQWLLVSVPAIVSEDLFAAAQEQLEENRNRARLSSRGARYLLQGMVVCKCCGYALYGKSVSPAAGKGKRRHYAYYRCIGTDAYRFGGQRVCRNKQVRTDLLEQAVWEDVSNLLADPQRVGREHERRLEGERDGSAQDEQKLAAAIQKARLGIARLIDAYGEGLLEKMEFEPRVRAAKERLSKLEAQQQAQRQEEASRVEVRLVIGHLETFASRVQGGLASADWKTKRDIIRSLVKRVEVDTAEVRVVYRVAPDPFDQAPSRGILQDCRRRALSAAVEHPAG